MLKKVVRSMLVAIAFASVSFAEEKVRIAGEYSYTYGDNETLTEAKNISFGMAVRNAIESYKTFIVATSTVSDHALIKDLIQTISSGYIENLKIVEQRISGRNVYTSVQGYIVPAVVDSLLEREVKKHKQEPEAVDDNGYLRILNVKRVRESQGEVLEVIVKIVEPVNSGSLFYDAAKYKVCIDFFNSRGEPTGGDCGSIRDDMDKMVHGQLTTIRFESIPTSTTSYRAWLVK